MLVVQPALKISYLEFISLDTDHLPIVCGEWNGQKCPRYQRTNGRKAQSTRTTKGHDYISWMGWCGSIEQIRKPLLNTPRDQDRYCTEVSLSFRSLWDVQFMHSLNHSDSSLITPPFDRRSLLPEHRPECIEELKEHIFFERWLPRPWAPSLPSCLSSTLPITTTTNGTTTTTIAITRVHLRTYQAPIG